MTTTMTRWTVGAISVCVTLAFCGVWVAGGEGPPKPPPARAEAAPAGKPPFGFNILKLDANDLAAAYSLNVYKFKVDVPKGQKFHVVLRELGDKDAAPRQLFRFSFRRGDKDGPTTLRVDFTRMDGAAGSVLLTEQKEAKFRVDCPDCTPSGLATIVPVPLSGVKLNGRTLVVHRSDKDNIRWGLKETCLLSIFSNVKGNREANYPRAELLIEKE